MYVGGLLCPRVATLFIELLISLTTPLFRGLCAAYYHGVVSVRTHLSPAKINPTTNTRPKENFEQPTQNIIFVLFLIW
ncbi:hypothetical protein BN938_1911 [Mucinivorans hirudinis]|uniref:Uncharacterized protein n=1 Tax=Mucinivorans hirudinis TaxID=1433126 RepID=A0A060R8W6_9BACT|nr:hypothetical protein BN938_1911 [Mucinivorans hirudinis]